MSTALVLGMCLFGSLPGHCFCNSAGQGDELAAARLPESKAVPQSKYAPCPEALRASGPVAKANPARFSAEYHDDKTDQVYYGYRYYNSSTGKWLSRDPAEEDDGGPNLYGFIGNNAVSGIDFVGLLCPCDVQSFSIKSRKWIGNLPAKWTIFGYSKQLKTEFKLVLKPGSDKSSCRIAQNKKGAARSNRGNWTSANWVPDGGDWWDGSSRSIAYGNWSGLTAVFRDTPGIYGAFKRDFPVYYNVDFYTFVVDASKPGSPEVAHLSWGVFIYYHSPSTGYEISN
jgi:RHS repeat-associated protein